MKQSIGLLWTCAENEPDYRLSGPLRGGSAVQRPDDPAPTKALQGSKSGGRQRESNLPGNGCRPQPGLKPGRATGRDCLP